MTPKADQIPGVVREIALKWISDHKMLHKPVSEEEASAILKFATFCDDLMEGKFINEKA